ncbi:P3 protein [Lepeophtheirus salmonis]|uniref:Uncharacterized protein n=1 Tax=Lepeophtheirus salmonis TaxID=72036 RepID=A0A0K2T2W1_LEPSM|nr:ileal sodium/bile acid cotransporter-like [Lepeophtheirus salmonis]
MCPLYPFHMILLYLCLLLPLLFAIVEGAEELVSFGIIPSRSMKLTEYDSTELKATCVNCPPELKELTLSTSSKKVAWISAVEGSDIYHQKRSLLESDYDQSVVVPLREGQVGNWTIAFNVTADFLGFSKIKASLSPSSLVPSSTLKMSVLRRPTVASRIFTSSVAILISLAYINMGCAMDLDVVKSNLKSPVGPIIGFLSQFIAMPLISFALGFVFVDSAPLRLGLFVTGVSPGGGASNIWTLMLGGSLDLSLTMTTISTLSAFFMMPLWLFTLGQFIFDKTDIVIPYLKILTYATCLIVPLLIGVGIKIKAPRVSKFMVSILKPMALALLLFIIVFGIYANQYIFYIMDYKVWCVGMALPWFGFMFGWIVSILCDRKMEDKIAIAIETGIQNTGVSIFILWFTLDRPLGDLAAVIPVGAAMMTPIPLLCGLIFLKIKSTFCAKSTEYTSGNIEDGSFTRDGKAALSTVSSIVKLSALDNRNLEPLA